VCLETEFVRLGDAICCCPFLCVVSCERVNEDEEIFYARKEMRKKNSILVASIF
jgi:hypothetical protein